MKRPDFQGSTIETYAMRGGTWGVIIDGATVQGDGWITEGAAWAGAQTEIRRRKERSAHFLFNKNENPGDPSLPPSRPRHAEYFDRKAGEEPCVEDVPSSPGTGTLPGVVQWHAFEKALRDALSEHRQLDGGDPGYTVRVVDEILAVFTGRGNALPEGAMRCEDAEMVAFAKQNCAHMWTGQR